MNEIDWFNCCDPRAMLEFLLARGEASSRKLRLFGCACSRRLWHLLQDRRCQEVMEVIEQYADGGASEEGFHRMPETAQTVWYQAYGDGAISDASTDAYATLFCATNSDPGEAAVEASRVACEAATREGDAVLEKAGQASVLRDLFGPLPFRMVHINPVWLTLSGGTVVKLARVAYEEREMPSGHLDRTRLAVLADGLEEAGCDQADLLDHLRGPGPCVRGCWALDLLLAKE